MELFKINCNGIITNKAGVPVDKTLLSRIIKAAGKSMDTAPERKEAPIQVEIPTPESDEYINFRQWITDYAPNVNKMAEPFNMKQFLQLMEWRKEKKPGYSFGEIKEMLVAMHNWKDLKKKNTSAFYTMVNWTENKLRKALYK